MELGKRVYLDEQRTVTCPVCKQDFEIDFSEQHLSYPEINETNEFYCLCAHCHIALTIPYRLTMQITLVDEVTLQ